MKRTPLKRKPQKFKRRKTVLKKQSSREIPKLKRTLWRLVSRYIRERDNWKCYTCGAVAYGVMMHAGHFITRNNASTLFDPRNVHAQCASCNIWLRGNVAVYAQRLLIDLGKEGFAALVARGKEIKRWDARGLKAMIAALKEGKDFDEEYEKIYTKY